MGPRFDGMKSAALSLVALAALLCGRAAADGFWPTKAPGGSRDLLRADQAFHLLAATREGDTLKVSWDIAPGYYLYRKRLRFAVAQPTGATLDAPQLPRGQMVHDEQGDAEVYRGSLQAVLHWPRGGAAPQKLQLGWQGCAEAGVCYPPQTSVVDVLDLSR
jgi:thiol:disulfide interchange protein DsbD